MDVRVERTARMLIHGYFASRAEKLNSLTVDDLVTDAKCIGLCLHRVGQVDDLLSALLRENLRSFDDTAQSDLTTALIALIGSDSETGAIQLVHKYSDVEYMFHGDALSRAMNLLSVQFFRRFAFSNGQIDWESFNRAAQGDRIDSREEVLSGIRSQ